jgi:hypothetical protein
MVSIPKVNISHPEGDKYLRLHTLLNAIFPSQFNNNSVRSHTVVAIDISTIV